VLAVDELAGALRGAGAGAPAADDPRLRAIVQRLEPALARAPDDAALNLAAAALERLRGSPLQAIKHFRRAAAASPSSVEAWLGAAEVCLSSGLYGEADQYARLGIAAQTARGAAVDPRLRHALARALAGQGRLDDAILHLEPWVRMRPQDRDAARLLSSLLMGRAVQRLSDPKVTHDELQGLVDRALAVNPEEPRVDLVRARLLRDQRRFAEAVAALDRAIAALPEFADAKTQLAENLRDQGYECWRVGDEDGAAASWRRFLQVAPAEMPTDAVRMQLQGLWRRAESAGIAAAAGGDRQGAERAFRRCLLIDPDQHWACYLLATVLRDRADADAAELDRLTERALQWQERHGLEKSRQVALRVLVLRRFGRAEEARRLAQGYLESPDDGADPGAVELLRAVTRG
jgi:tetratricopeptide (TPR) repeat protein